MENKLLVLTLLILGWVIIFSIIKIQVPELSSMIIFLPLIAIGGLLSILLIIFIFLIAFWMIIGIEDIYNDLYDEIYRE